MKKFLYLCLVLCFTSLCFPVKTSQKETYYCDTTYFDSGGSSTYIEETINFDYYTVDEIFMNRPCPNYKNLTQENSCVPMAASIVVGYYDFNFPNLIPNYDAGYYYNGKFYYKGQNSDVIAMKENLYYLMGTNSEASGTSVNQFKNGLSLYVSEKGYNINYKECGNKFNLNDVKNSFENQQPVILFVNSYTYYDYNGISFTPNSMTLLKKQRNTGHAAVAYGYKQFNFYNNDTLIRTDNYLVVVFGDGTSGYLAINNVESIDKTISIKIY